MNIKFLLPALLLTVACSAQQPVSVIRFSGGKQIVLLTGAQAAQAITYDRTDLFFDRVTASEMSIQMKRPLKAGETRRDLVADYIQFLKQDVEDFTPVESQFVGEVMEEVARVTETVAPGLMPTTLQLIKTKGQHLGDGTYYTRENCIIIPANVLRDRDRAEFLSTMFHELSHVISRQNPQLRRQLYALIGFEDVGLANLQMPTTLSERLFYNPDGVDFAQKISLRQPDGSMISAIPVIYANHVGYLEGKKEFFSYMEFNLFQIEPAAGGQWRVLTAEDGFTSTLDIRKQRDFFRQIKDNTGYIIHPDEVLADNFSFLMRSKNDPNVSAKFSPEGKQLLVDLERTLKQ